MGRRDKDKIDSLEWDVESYKVSRDTWKQQSDLNFDLLLKEMDLSDLRFKGWKREYDKRKALEQEVAASLRTYQVVAGDRAAALAEITRLHGRLEDQGILGVRIQDLEKENALLEGENRDLGTRILDLTRKLTEANDRRLCAEENCRREKADKDYYKKFVVGLC